MDSNISKTVCALLALSSLASGRQRDQLDYIIVGGGIAGLVVAEELSQNPNVSVTLLEAGPDGTNEPMVNTPLLAPLLTETEYLWQYTSQPDPNLGGRAPTAGQGRALGGGSAVNYMAYCRAAPSIYDEWAAISGNRGLRYENLFQDFKATTHYQEQNLTYDPRLNASAYDHGSLQIAATSDTMDWTLQFTKAMKDALGLPQVDLNGGDSLGVTSGASSILASNRTRSYALTAFGWKMADRPNVHIRHGAWVSKILFENKQAIGVRYHDTKDNSTHELHAREIILAGGAINTPKLLLLSGVGPQNDLRALSIPLVLDAPHVGSNLYNHHFSVISYEAYPHVETLGKYMQNQTFSQQSNMSYAQNGSGILGQTSAPFAVAQGPNNTSWGGINGTYSKKEEEEKEKNDRGQLLYQLTNGALIPGIGSNTSTLSAFVALIQPQSTGSIRLNSSSYRIPPLINSNYYGHPSDKSLILHGYKQLRRIMQQPCMTQHVVQREIFPGPLVADDDDEGLWKAIQETAQTFYHPVGTCALGNVVDGRNWRVKGLEGGLRVVDSSTLPSPPSCHLQASVYAVARRAARDIRRDDDDEGCFV